MVIPGDGDGGQNCPREGTRRATVGFAAFRGMLWFLKKPNGQPVDYSGKAHGQRFWYHVIPPVMALRARHNLRGYEK